MESNFAVKSDRKFSYKNYDNGQRKKMVTRYKYSNTCNFLRERFETEKLIHAGEI